MVLLLYTKKRNMKNIIFLQFLFLCCACSKGVKNGLDVFDAKVDSVYTVVGHQDRNQGVLWISDTSDTHPAPIFKLSGSWDFSEYSHLKVSLKNGNERESINVNFKLLANDSLLKEGFLTAKKLLNAGEITEWFIPIPATPANLQVLDKLVGMRANPFYIDGVLSNLSPKNVNSIQISFDKSLKGIKLGIKQISRVKGEAVSLPTWYQKTAANFFPFIDKYGQFMHKDWPGKVKIDRDLAKAYQSEVKEFKNIPSPNDRSVYGGFKLGIRQEVKGYFYVKKIDGKWWMIDPEGYPFWSHGVVRVTPSSAVTIIDNRRDFFVDLPKDKASTMGEFYITKDEFLYKYYKSWDIKETYDFSAANLKIKYGNNWRSTYTDMVQKRLTNWGMNTISAGSDPNIYQNINVPYCDRIELVSPKIDGVPEKLNAIRDPYHLEFTKQFRSQLQSRGAELNSKFNYGYFIDNKLVWGADYDLSRWVLKSSSNQPAKLAFVDELKRKYQTIAALNAKWKSAYKSWNHLLASKSEPTKLAYDDCRNFSGTLIEAYFKKVSEVMKDEAPGKLNLGCRYVNRNERVLRIAAKYCDILTFDLFVDSLDDFALPKGIDKPVLIGEFHFGALDRGLFNPGLNQKNNQIERAAAYKTYVTSALKNPFIVGTSWHQFSDQATTGRFDGENFQDGLTDVCDNTYPETISAVRDMGQNLYKIRK